MDALFVQLACVIQKEVVAFQRLLGSLEREQEALVRQDVAGIQAAVEEQKSLVRTSRALEKERARIVNGLSSALREDRVSLTLKRLIERVRGPQADQLRQMRETLLELHEKIRRTSRHNALLIKQSMRYIDKSLQLLSGGGGSAGTYASSGKLEGPGTSRQGVVNQVV